MTPRFDIAKHMKMCGRAGHAEALAYRGDQWSRAVAARAGQDSSLPDQRLRVLPRHAHQGCAGAWRDRAADLRAERLARDALLHATRASRPGVDRGGDPGAETRVPDDVYRGVRPHFTEEELLSLTFEVIVINSWNRLAIASRAWPARISRSSGRIPERLSPVIAGTVHVPAIGCIRCAAADGRCQGMKFNVSGSASMIGDSKNCAGAG